MKQNIKNPTKLESYLLTSTFEAVMRHPKTLHQDRTRVGTLDFQTSQPTSNPLWTFKPAYPPGPPRPLSENQTGKQV